MGSLLTPAQFFCKPKIALKIESIEKIKLPAGCCWVLMPVILATWETEIRRITVPAQLRETINETPSPN
jgi:hypothetical protein